MASHVREQIVFTILQAVTLLLVTALPHAASAAEQPIEKLLPAPSCAEGWVLDGKVQLFDKDSLFDRINGESELYFPYGFRQLAYARYESKRDTKVAIDVDLYEMGSQLDAFGIYANYRRKDAADAGAGTEGTITSSQMLFYQDRYFIRLQVTGATALPQEVFRACGRAVALNLPRAAGPPADIEALNLPVVVKKSERYIAQSLLGYEFFLRGFIADVRLDGGQSQIILVPERSPEAAQQALDRYRAYLNVLGKGVLEGSDPLYGTVVIEQAGRYLVGVVRVKDKAQAKQVIGQVKERISRN